MLPRTLETEVMDSPAEAADYDSMDHREVNRLFIDHLLSTAGGLPAGRLQVLDVGTGTAQIPIELVSRAALLQVVAVDAAAHMLQLGLRNVIRAGLTANIRLEEVDAKRLPHADRSFDWVISNSIVHHIPQPSQVLSEMVRVARPGGLLFVRDLLRPKSAAQVDQIVDTYAAGAIEHQRQMFRDSLHAALTLDEIRQMMEELRLDPNWVTQTSDRHWTIAGRLRQ